MALRGAEGGFWAAAGWQLRDPRGPGGWLAGRLMWTVNRRPTALAVDFLDLHEDHHVLDLGCGPGQAVRLLARRVNKGLVDGLDGSALMLVEARAANRAAIAQRRVVLRQGRFEHLPYADNTFDRILASNVIYFWEDVPAVVREMERVLKPGGRIVIYATDARSMRRWPFAGSASHRLFDASSLRSELEAAGVAAPRLFVAKVKAGWGVKGLIAMIHGR